MFFLRKAAIRTTDWLVNDGSINIEEREIYEYGFNKLYSIFTNFLFAVLFGLIFGMLFLTLTFYAAYFVIRIYAGGIHAETEMRCFFLSTLVIIPCQFVIRFYYIWNIILWNIPIIFYALLACSVATLLYLAPVGSKNKMPDVKERSIYRRRMIRNLMVLVVLAIILSLLLHQYASAVLIGVLLSAIMTIVGKVKLKFQGMVSI